MIQRYKRPGAHQSLRWCALCCWRFPFLGVFTRPLLAPTGVFGIRSWACIVHPFVGW